MTIYLPVQGYYYEPTLLTGLLHCMWLTHSYAYAYSPPQQPRLSSETKRPPTPISLAPPTPTTPSPNRPFVPPHLVLCPRRDHPPPLSAATPPSGYIQFVDGAPPYGLVLASDEYPHAQFFKSISRAPAPDDVANGIDIPIVIRLPQLLEEAVAAESVDLEDVGDGGAGGGAVEWWTW